MGIIEGKAGVTAEQASRERQKNESRTRCCPGLQLVLDFASKWPDGPRRPSLPGIQVAHVFEAGTGRFKGSPLVYVLPARGRGKERTKATNILMEHCPFCGKKLDKHA